MAKLSLKAATLQLQIRLKKLEYGEKYFLSVFSESETLTSYTLHTE